MAPAERSGRRTSTSGGKGRAGSRLGLKKSSSTAPSRPPTSSPVPPPPLPSLEVPVPPPVPTPATVVSSPAVLSSSPALLSSSVMPQPARVGWGPYPQFFPLNLETNNPQIHGKHLISICVFPNSWLPVVDLYSLEVDACKIVHHDIEDCLVQLVL